MRSTRQLGSRACLKGASSELENKTAGEKQGKPLRLPSLKHCGSWMTLKETLDELREAIEYADLRDTRMSLWTVGMHIHHCCLVMSGVCNSALQSEAPMPKSRFSFWKFIVFRFRRIPRWRVQAPAAVQPGESLAKRELEAMLDESIKLIRTLRDDESERWFKHFIFGVLERDEIFHFFAIHNEHHLRIIYGITGE